MIQTQAIIIHLVGQEAVVESTPEGGCGSCDQKNGCGSSKLSKLFPGESRRFRVRNDSNAKVGATVQVNLPEGVLLQSALLMYMMPLVFLIIGAMLGAQLAFDGHDSDMTSAIGGFAGLALGFLVVKGMLLRRRMSSFDQPVIVASADAEQYFG